MCVTFNMNDWPARIDPEEAKIGRPTAIARRLVEASVRWPRAGPRST